MSTAYNDKIAPAIKDTLDKALQVAQTLYEELSATALTLFERAVDHLKTYEGDFKKIAASLSESFKKVAQVVQKYADIVRKEVNDIYNLVVDQIKSLPGYENLKERIDDVSTVCCVQRKQLNSPFPLLCLSSS